MNETNTMTEVAEDLLAAMRSGVVGPGQATEGMQLCVDSLKLRHPDAPLPERLCPFTLLVGGAFVLAVECYRTEEEKP